MAEVGDLTAKLKLDTAGFSSGISEAEGMMGKLAGGIGTAVAGIAGAVTAAVGAAAAGIGKLVSDSVQSFADYEQLVGGVETLFKDSAGIVEEYANEAYRTAGISANEYMSTVTSFSAALLQGLQGDTEEAARVADMAITDMADNANKMGTDMASIQAAYQGFAKQNYTMLDNLKLGYGGTRTEMERLLADAEALTGIHYDIENLNEVYEAIHVIQKEMGITGTTAEEAASTVAGSWGMVQSSFQDLITSISGGGKGMQDAIKAFMESVRTFAENIVPVIKEALYGIGDLIEGIVPMIADLLPSLIEDLLPTLIDAAITLISRLVEALPQILTALISVLPDIVSGIAEVVARLIVLLLTEIFPQLIELAITIILALGEALVANAEMIIDALVQLIIFMLNVIIENLPLFIEMGLQIILAIAEALVLNIEQLTNAIAQGITAMLEMIVTNLPEFLWMGVQIIVAIVAGIVLAIPMLIKALFDAILGIEDTETQATTKFDNIQAQAATTSSTVDSYMSSVRSSANSAASSTKTSTDHIVDYASTAVTKVYDAEGNIIGSLRTMSAGSQEYIVGNVMTNFDKAGQFVSQTEMSIDSSSGSMVNTADTAESTITTGMDAIASSASAAADAVEDAADRMNSALGSISGGTIDIDARAGGGPVSAGVPYMTGELGRELFVPATDGYVLDHNDTEDFLDDYAGGSGGISIVINGDIYDDENSMRRKMRTAVLDVIETELAYG